MQKSFFLILILSTTLYSALFPPLLHAIVDKGESSHVSLEQQDTPKTEAPAQDTLLTAPETEDTPNMEASDSSTPAAPTVTETESPKPDLPEIEAPTPEADTGMKLAKDSEISVSLLLRDGTVREISMREYLIGVLAGEVPGDFHPEALKAQAIAGRTHVLYNMLSENREAHPQAAACCDPGCCSAWLDEDARNKVWNDHAEEFYANVAAAVDETDGKCIFYGDELILAAYHSSSDKRTASCASVWYGDLPYLVSVESPETDALVPDYVRTVPVSREKYIALVTAAVPEASFSIGAPLITSTVYDASGRLQSVTSGGQVISGSLIRSIFGLSSASVTMELAPDKITFTTVGSGHGVGLSQYGAQALAVSGMDCIAILEHYYSGTYVAQLVLYM